MPDYDSVHEVIPEHWSYSDYDDERIEEEHMETSADYISTRTINLSEKPPKYQQYLHRTMKVSEKGKHVSCLVFLRFEISKM